MQDTYTISGMTELVGKLQDMAQEKRYYGFAWFMIQEFGDGNAENLGDEERRKIAWECFRQAEKKAARQGKSGCCLEATAKTKRKWFDLESDIFPKRKQIIQLAYELEFSPQKWEHYLRNGLGQPGIQYNDYREWLYAYGLENRLSYGQVEEMIYRFEVHMTKDQMLCQNTHTNWLKERYQENIHLTQDEFLEWMYGHAGVFKGYSKTALHYFEKCKDAIVKLLRKEEKKELQWLLECTDYARWKQDWMKTQGESQEKGNWEEQELERIRRYVRYASRRKDALSAEMCQSILYAARLVYGKENRHHLLSSLYPVRREKGDFPELLFPITDKKMSDLLHIAKRKAQEIHLSWEQASLQEADKDTAKIQEKRKKAQSRVVLLDRTHLLPLIHYLAQMKYMEHLMESEGTEYRQAEAMKYFTDMANDALQACGMEPVSEKFALDYVLLSCFGREELYPISDVMEIIDQYIS